MTSDRPTMQLTVIGEGRVNVAPDQARITLGFDVLHPDAATARRAADQTMLAVVAALRGAGIESRHLRTARYTVETRRDHQERSRLLGYQVTNQIEVTVVEVERVGEIIDLAVQSGANDVRAVRFSVEDESAVRDAAREAAMRDARRKAEQMARLGGVQLGLPIEMGEESVTSWRDDVVYERADVRLAAASGAAPIEPGERETTVRVRVVYAIHH